MSFVFKQNTKSASLFQQNAKSISGFRPDAKNVQEFVVVFSVIPNLSAKIHQVS